MGPKQPPIQRMSWAIFPGGGVKRPGFNLTHLHLAPNSEMSGIIILFSM